MQNKVDQGGHRNPRADKSASEREHAGRQRRPDDDERRDDAHSSPGAAHAGSDAGPEEDNNP